MTKSYMSNTDWLTTPKAVALLVMDVQNDFCSKGGVVCKYYKKFNPDIGFAVRNIKNLLEICRKEKIFRIFIKSHFNNKYKLPFLLEKHKFLNIKNEICKEDKWGSEFYKIKPLDDEPIIVKHTNDAFLYTFLEPLLRSYGIKTLILTGMLTESCIDTTAKSAQSRGYFVVVPKDCTASYNKKAHQYIMKIMKKSFIITDDSKNVIRSLNNVNDNLITVNKFVRR